MKCIFNILKAYNDLSVKKKTYYQNNLYTYLRFKNF
jgi:hypothetical protein